MARPQTFSKKENEKKKSEIENRVSFVFHIGRFSINIGEYRFRGKKYDPFFKWFGLRGYRMITTKITIYSEFRKIGDKIF